MNVNEYPSGRPGIPVPQELFEASRRLREANHSGEWKEQAVSQLEQFAQALTTRRPFSTEDEIYYLWSLCLQAEIHDYYGDYDLARLVLKATGPELEAKMNADELGVSARTLKFSGSLLRQQLWTLVFYAHCFYRDGRYKEAQDLLENRIRGQLDRHLPLNTDEPSYGLRARVSYSLGQVKRQQADIAGVREEFMKSIEFTRKRLLAKLDLHSKLEVVCQREKRYSNYFLAKAFAFGLAWASYNSGELDRARTSAAAGCALLEATEDEVYKAYAQVMYAQILIAKTPPIKPGQPNPPELQEAFSILQDLVEKPESALRRIPKFLARAQYALAGALFASGQYDRAESLAKTIYESTAKGSRWHLDCAALRIRILLRQEKIEEARRCSDEFLDLVHEKNMPQNARAEALLCRAEVLLKSKSNLEEIEKALNEAQALWVGNPLATVLVHLHRARLHVLQKNASAAHHELSQWKASERRIEQGYVHELARDVANEIAGINNSFIITAQDMKGGYDSIEDDLKRWAIRLLYSQCGKDYLKNGNPQRILRKSPRTIREWQQKLDFDPTV